MACEKCRNYWNNGKDEYCEKRGWDFKRTDCPDFRDKSKPITNYDLLRAKSVEEMAEFFNGVEAEAIRRAGLFITVGDIQRGKEGWLDWLKQEAET